MMAGPPPPGTPAAALYAAAQAQAQLRAQAQSQPQAQQSPLPIGSPIPTASDKPANGLAPPTSGPAESVTSDGEANTPLASSKSVGQLQLALPFISRKHSSAEKEQEAEVVDVHISDTYGIRSDTYHVCIGNARAPKGACKLSRKKVQCVKIRKTIQGNPRSNQFIGTYQPRITIAFSPAPARVLPDLSTWSRPSTSSGANLWS
jgi:hypothetical protein